MAKRARKVKKEKKGKKEYECFSCGIVSIKADECCGETMQEK